MDRETRLNLCLKRFIIKTEKQQNENNGITRSGNNELGTARRAFVVEIQHGFGLMSQTLCHTTPITIPHSCRGTHLYSNTPAPLLVVRTCAINHFQLNFIGDKKALDFLFGREIT